MLPDKKMRLLVIGSGGREHALCWKLARSSKVDRIFCAPGNGGTQQEEKTTNVPIAVSDFGEIAVFCHENKVDLVIVGPDNPLAEGIVDHLQEERIRVFGPTKEQAKLEWSKAHAKEFMTRVNLPTARYLTCHSFADAQKAVRENDWARVVKVDGLALGKGVFVCQSLDESLSALKTIFQDKSFGAAGECVVIEERIEGAELSLLMLTDGRTVLVLEPSQDYKRRFDRDEGPNTGGMGAYSPVDLYTCCKDAIDKDIVQPIKDALKNQQLDFMGVLYAGIMLVGSQEDIRTGRNLRPTLLEFNARFGDPETQALLPRLDSDLLPALWACTTGELDKVELEWSSDSSCCVVAVAEGYPKLSSKDKPLTIAKPEGSCFIFHAGTKSADGQVMTNGGRILSVVATAPSMESAAALSYQALEGISFEGLDYRRDIARRAFKECLSS